MKFTPLQSPQPGSVVCVPTWEGDDELCNAMLWLERRGGAIAVHPNGCIPVTRVIPRPMNATLECPACQSTLGLCGCRYQRDAFLEGGE